ncbi:MAG: hypothetical protein DME88_09500 [Verrucomicrobia bacterium]|nr:MAG: hypothetical protein DME88_09500 [Verrucomicrobiota bacterium]
MIETREHDALYDVCGYCFRSIDSAASAMRTCQPVFLTDLITTRWRHADVVSLEGFTPHITLYAGVGAVGASGPALSSRPVLLRNEIARCGSHANVIRRLRLSPDVSRRAHVALGLCHWRKHKAGKREANEKWQNCFFTLNHRIH